MIVNNNLKNDINFNNIIIFGVGLLGGSLALVLKKKQICNNVIGIDINENNLKVAFDNKAIDKGILNFDKDIIYNSDLIILCTPMLVYEDILSGISDYLNPNVIITDIGSTKRDVIKNFFQFIPKFIIPNCVAAHPIAGSEKSGTKHMDYNLFEGKKTFITPHDKQNEESLIKITKMWNKIGSKTYIMDFNEHDFIFSCVSHLPHILSFVYSNQIFNLDKDLIKYAGSGFQDFTRISASNADVWIDIFFENMDLLIPLINDFSDKLQNFKDILINKNRTKLKEFILVANKLLEKNTI